MHKYLRAIGFTNFNSKKSIDEFLNLKLSDECLESSYQTLDNRLVGQFMLKICPNAGISVIGEEVKSKTIVDYYYPFVKGVDYTIIEECTIERQSDREAYLGVIDDYRLGMSLIFYLINSNMYSSYLKNADVKNITIDRVFLSSLSIGGKIILPLKKKEKVQNKFSNAIIEDSKITDIKLPINKNENVEEDDDDDDDDVLEPQDVAMGEALSKIPAGMPFSILNKDNMSISVGIAIPNMGNLRNGALAKLRTNKEDLYSIVDTSIVPWGIECDKYSVVAEIVSVTYRENQYTKEKLVEMRVNALGLAFNIMINENDLDGEPLPGRRFVGVIWMLGEIEFSLKDKKLEKRGEASQSL